MPPGGGGRLVITIRMPPNARTGVQNCISIPPGVNPNDPNRGNDRMCIPVRVTPRPDPDIQTLKFQTTDECDPGGDCTFDLWFINRGPGSWRGQPILTDALPPGATLRRQSAGWSCRQNGSTVTCTHGTVTLKPWRGVKVSVTVRLPDNIAAGAKNCVRIAGSAASSNDPVLQNNVTCITINTTVPTAPTTPSHQEPPPTTAPPQPPHASTEKTQLGPCKPGSSCLFELKFTNRGPGSWTGKARLADVLPSSGITLGTWSPSSWRCSQNGQVVICEHSGATIGAGEHLSVTLTLRLPDDFHAGAQNCVTVDRPGVDPAHSPDRNCVPINVTTPGFAPHPPGVVQPTPPPAAPPTPPPTQHAECPEGSVKRGDQCLSCPKGTVLRGTKCYSTKRTCPAGYVLRGKRCYAKVRRVYCPPGYARVGRVCVRLRRSVPHYIPHGGGGGHHNKHHHGH